MLQRAENMLEHRNGDVVVTAEKAEELSRARAVKRAAPATPKAEAGAGTAPKRANIPREAAAGSSTPGAAPRGTGDQPTADGTLPQVTARAAKPRVRTVAPGVLPVPGQNAPRTP